MQFIKIDHICNLFTKLHEIYSKYTILYICNLSKLISKTIIKSNFTCTGNVMIFILTTDMDHSALMKNILLKCEIE